MEELFFLLPIFLLNPFFAYLAACPPLGEKFASSLRRSMTTI